MRLDALLVDKYDVESRNKAQHLIHDNKVLINNCVVNKPAYVCKPNDKIKIISDAPYVSVGAFKLLIAIKHWKIRLDDLNVLDIGSSTGGFTQVALANNAKHVYCVDVGTQQLHHSLRNNRKITLYENTNFKSIRAQMFDHVDFVVADVSFISLTQLITTINQVFKSPLSGVFLIKPQFELSPSEVKGGYVKSLALRNKAVNKVVAFAKQRGFIVHGTTPTIAEPSKKQKNIEYLMYWSKL